MGVGVQIGHFHTEIRGSAGVRSGRGSGIGDRAGSGRDTGSGVIRGSGLILAVSTYFFLAAHVRFTFPLASVFL